MHIKSRGFVLIVVLLFLAVFAVLALSSIRMNTMELKMVRNDWQKQMILNTSEFLLNKVAREFDPSSSQCIDHIGPNIVLAKQPVSWWKSVSCAGNFQRFTYYYVIESLGVDYFRVSMLVSTDEHQNERVILQSVIVKTNIAMSRQSWRELA